MERSPWAGRRGIARLFARTYRNDHSISFSSAKLRTELLKIEIPAEDRTWRQRYVSYTLVFDYRAARGAYLEISHARPYDSLLDNRSRHHRIGPRWRSYPHVFSPEERTISSSRPHFFYTGRHPDSLRLL